MLQQLIMLALLGLVFYLLWRNDDLRMKLTAEVELWKHRHTQAMRDYRETQVLLREKTLTRTDPKAQDVPKRYSGPQLRRMSDQVNAADTTSLQERPNSEVLNQGVYGDYPGKFETP